MRERMQRFMYGRYGNDELNRTILVGIMIFLVLSWITRWNIFYSLGIVLLILSYYRMFSRNISKRYQENQKYMVYHNKIKYFFVKKKNHAAQMKTYRFFKCPNCKQKVRVPKGKGKIAITCPSCRKEFIKRS